MLQVGSSVGTKRTALRTSAATALALACACSSARDDQPPPPAAIEAAPPPPTFHGEVAPLLSEACGDCHREGGAAGYPFDARNATALSWLIAERVASRDMPPWLPGPLGVPTLGSRRLDDRDIATLVAWHEAGAPLGEPDGRPLPRRATVPAPDRAPDLRLVAAGYALPLDPRVADEPRCFVIDVPPEAYGAWITALRWAPGTARGIHHISGTVLDEAAAERARSLEGADGRPGFDCTGGLATLAPGIPLAPSGSGDDLAAVLPAGTGVLLPDGAAVVLAIHYAPHHLLEAPAPAGVELWLARGDAAAALRPLAGLVLSAPVELPCPGGAVGERCSRAHALALRGKTEREADAALAACGTSLGALHAVVSSEPDAPELLVTTSCTRRAPFAGQLHAARLHMRTFGTRGRVEMRREDGTWHTVLDIPRWDRGWEGAYRFARGVPIARGTEMRVSCTHDNGTANQWSEITGLPGHGDKALAPLLPPAYVVSGTDLAAESCTAELLVERAPAPLTGRRVLGAR
jgi:hypothetical protein